MSAAASVPVAVTFGWLGMVLAFSFLEAPLKFRAPASSGWPGSGGSGWSAGVASGGAGRSAEDLHDLSGLFFRAGLGLGLGRGRARRVLNSALAGAPRSHAHDADVALEAVKVIALLVGGILLLTGAGRTWSG